jgi:hypothetical protein
MFDELQIFHFNTLPELWVVGLVGPLRLIAQSQFELGLSLTLD